MKKRNMYIIAVIIIILVVILPVVVNRIYSARLDHSYTELSTVSSDSAYTIVKIPLKGRLKSEHSDSSANYNSSIYMDTVKLNFKVETVYAADGNEITAYTTFNGNGKIIEIQRYVPHHFDGNYVIDLETIAGNGKQIQVAKDVTPDQSKHLQDCVLLNGILPPWPKWKDKTSPVYIKHFSKERLYLSDLNPFTFGGIHGSAKTSVWYGNAYCDIQFIDRVIKIKIPFGYDNLLLNTANYYANMQYYTLPKAHLKSMPVRLLTLDDDVYIINQR